MTHRDARETGMWIDLLRQRFQVDRVAAQYQPLIRLGTGAVIGYEALARFTTPCGDPVSPQGVFQHLHRCGGRVLADADLDLKRLQLAAAPDRGTIFLNINTHGLSGRHGTDLAARLGRLRALRPDIVLEMVEANGKAHGGALETATGLLKRRGLALALDDIGAPGSLVSLHQMMQVDYLKFDRAWLARRDAPLGHPGLAMLDSLLGFARATGKVTVLEGVETAEHLDFAHRIGVDVVQGFLFGAGDRSDDLALADVVTRPEPRAGTARRLRALGLATAGELHP